MTALALVHPSHSWTTYQFSEDEAETECDDCMVRPYNADASAQCVGVYTRDTVDQQMVRFLADFTYRRPT